MRPDEDQRLTSMGMSEETCEKCMMELYSDAPDTICDDCALNAVKANPKGFVASAMKREDVFSLDELISRHRKLNT